MSCPQLDSAIGALEAEVADLAARPLKDGQPASSLWYMLQAKSLGLSLLRTLAQQNITDPVLVNKFRADLRIKLVQPPQETKSEL